ncbi:hypothetical protein SAMN05443270_4589 [Lacrimispora sphenoides]|jgi:hypothetical protein|uniref:hypothetical protein n=1 Tax=Lacrimispora sphenoides TaxID=29370 RepID=UPI00044B9DF2|nr:hypothetical protein [Lacrimispora sphenoides]EXG86536.1 hypothetical protein K413DRAFT_3373 [Clostridium sp. ASBs410]SEU28693.1 hypothetical protein SAMN05443270_4589 [Lacrimispora sphenoides]
MNEETLVFGKGIKIWSIICIVLSALSLIVNCTLGFFDLAVIGVAICAAYILLLVKKRKIAFYAIVVCTIIIMVLNVAIHDIGIVTSLSGFINPIITFCFLSKYWKQME